MSGAVCLLPLYAFMVSTGKTLIFPLSIVVIIALNFKSQALNQTISFLSFLSQQLVHPSIPLCASYPVKSN